MKLHTIETGFFKLDGGAMFGVVPKTIWQKLNQPDADNLCTWAMRCLLVETDDNRLVLIDTGIGNKQSEKFFGHYQPHGAASLQGSLAALGYSPNDITDVLLTHLHFDHVGGAVQRNEVGQLAATFPNAVYWSNEAHWQAAIQPNAREKASFLPENFVPLQQSGCLQMAVEGQEVAKGLSVKFVYGHTHAMMLPHIALPNGKELVYLADLAPSIAHLRIPFVMAYDTQPLISLREKESYFQTAANKNSVLFFEHDPQTECALMTCDEQGKPIVAQAGTLADLLGQ